MFDSKDVQAYQNIKAPSELKERITADCRREAVHGKRKIGGAFPMRRFVRSVSLIAACFALAIAIFSFTRMNTEVITLSYEGRELTAEPVTIARTETVLAANARETVPMGICLDFAVRGEAEVTVSGGCLFAASADGEEILSFGTTAVINDSTELWWAVVETSGSYELTVSVGDAQSVFVLELDENAPDGVIYKK